MEKLLMLLLVVLVPKDIIELLNAFLVILLVQVVMKKPVIAKTVFTQLPRQEKVVNHVTLEELKLDVIYLMQILNVLKDMGLILILFVLLVINH
jgi:hypothetical protein